MNKLLLGITALLFGGLTIASNAERNEEERYRQKTARTRDRYRERSRRLDYEYNNYRNRFR